jgi:hypothetical protein
MEQASILYDNTRMSLGEHKELIQQVLGHEKDSALTEPSKDCIPEFSIEQLGW